jgi:2-polyprenyl-3-methyl-5-hydroxy-6-metoxy-1,4-benzoquinol methylase
MEINVIKKITNKIRETHHCDRYRKVQNLINKKGKLLDVGCGRPCDSMENGSFIKFIGYGVGMDIKDCSSGSEFKKGDVLDIPFPEESFDIVVAMEILEHTDNIELALQNIYRVLKDDGIFIFSTPNNSLLWRIFWSIWKRSIGRMWIDSHKTDLNEKEWTKLLEKYFIIEKTDCNWLIDSIFKMRKRI